MRLTTTVCLALLSFSTLGCGGGSEAEKAMKESISMMNDISAAIDKNDEAALKKLEPQMKELGERMKKIKPSAEEEKSLQAKYEKEMTEALGKMMAAAMKNPQMAAKMQGMGSPFGK